MSKELEALEKIRQDFYDYLTNKYNQHNFDIIETALKDYKHSQKQRELYFKQAKELKSIELGNQKKLKGLEIIKEKRVNVGSFIKCCASLSYEEYKKQWSNWHKDILYNLSSELLTQDEYNLLKGALYD